MKRQINKHNTVLRLMCCFKGSFTVFLTTLRPRKTCSRRSKSLDQQSVFTQHVARSFVNLLEQNKLFWIRKSFNSYRTGLQRSYRFLNNKFENFSRTFKATFSIFQGLHSVQKKEVNIEIQGLSSTDCNFQELSRP